MSTHVEDPMAKEIRKKKQLARKHFNSKYKGKEREEQIPILSEVLYQIQACEELYRPVSENAILDWIDSENLAYIARKARSIKFA